LGLIEGGTEVVGVEVLGLLARDLSLGERDTHLLESVSDVGCGNRGLSVGVEVLRLEDLG
jgi:hypothetical protein